MARGRKVEKIGGNIKVATRIRPLTAKDPEGSVFIHPDPANPKALRTETAAGDRKYTFDNVFGPDALQREVYEETAQEIVRSAVDGYNGAIIAYGQTGSGKTHTMQGGGSDPGIVPRACRDLFATVKARERTTGCQYEVSVACFQLYKEGVHCMIQPKAEGEDKKGAGGYRQCSITSYGVTGACEVPVGSAIQLLDVIHKAEKNRHVAATNMNMMSSRSHACSVVTIIGKSVCGVDTTASQLYLLDLAGSESVDKTGSEGLTLDEAKLINVSLLSLRRVITALTEKTKHVPYRDSGLTTLLKGALGGNSRTCMIICVSPSMYNQRESVATLRFGQCTGTVQNVAVKTVQKSTKQLEAELAGLHAQIETAVMLKREFEKRVAAAAAAKGPGAAAAGSDAPPPSAVPLPLDGRSVEDAPPPDDFLCPLTGAVYTDPVCLSDGWTYERSAAEAYLKKHGQPPMGVYDSVVKQHALLVVPNTIVQHQMAQYYGALRRAAPSGQRSP
eukprot:TRINITY_DN702_c1_g4_i1.p1 TRINITY_DN702_c1_g4~~TRINITY_DN702_c1_g4_i1.p1  ORF type:complete len:502 (+),score=168.64 TRINITY_DN702_c1_g4_i1:62-1567(+)